MEINPSCPVKSGRQDSNLRPPGPKPGALPACATSRIRYFIVTEILTLKISAVRGGFEPPVQFNPYDSLANYWFQPLTHLTQSFILRASSLLKGVQR